MKSTPRDGVLRGGAARSIRLLLLAAALISGYLLYVSLTSGQVAGCGLGSSCDAVLKSQWAYVFGLPVSALALALDLTLLFVTFSCGTQSMPKQRRGAWEMLAPGAVLLLGAALWFSALQVFVLKRFCPWCLAAHICGAVAAVLLLQRVPVSEARERRDKDPGVASDRLVKFSALALLLLAGLGVAQTLTPVKTYSVSVVPEAVKPVAAAAEKSVEQQPAARTLAMFNGRVTLNLAEVPVWGSPNAPQQLVSIFDYTCSHCREMHERVEAVQRAFSNRLCVVSLPMPLDVECNALLRRFRSTTNPKQINGCHYARLGLAVALAKPDALPAYDHWFFTPATPPPLTEATNKAVALVGKAALDRALASPLIEKNLAAALRLFEINVTEYRKEQMPQMLIGTNVLMGIMTTEQLREKIAPYMTGAR